MKTITKEIQQQMSPNEALERLLDGNRRFMEGTSVQHGHAARVKDTANGQYPFAAVLGCIDSRAAAEHLFDQGIGDIFNARVAGNIVNEDILGSLEYACKVAGSKLILVLGHTACGAVTSACNQVELGNITSLLSKIQPAVAAFRDPASQVDKVAGNNVKISIGHIKEQSPILAQMEKDGEILIKGAMYDVATGKVELLQD